MFELSALQTEEVSGGFVWETMIRYMNRTIDIGRCYIQGIGAVGQTLSNYYGQEMTLQIMNGGNLGA